MKRKLISVIVSALLSSFSMVPAQAAENYEFDSSHSYVAWQINHLGFSTQTGKWFVTGKLSLDQDHPEKSKVEAKIAVAQFVTGIDALNEHLGGPEFFDVKKYPVATFVSDKVEKTSESTALVQGMLTVHGVTKPITLNVTLNKLAPNPFTQVMTAGFSASTQLKRSDFGINAYLPALGDEVEITIGAEANKK